MRIGIMQNAIDPGDLARAFRLAAEAKAEGVEVTCDRDEDIDALLGAEGIKRIKQLAGQHHVAVPSIGLGSLRRGESLFGDKKVISAAKDLIRRAMDAIAEIGGGVVLVPFLGKATIELETELDRVIAGLDELAEDAENAGVVLGIESTLNVNQQLYLVSHLEAFTSVKVYYDTGNALARKFDPATFLRDLGPDKVCQMHFKDVRLRQDVPPDFDMPLGAGDVDFPAIASALQAMRYDGWIILETPPTDEPLRAAKANIQFTRDLLARA